jgi:hypothetical protein
MKLQKLIIIMLVFITFPILTSATEPNENGRIVITQADEDAIKSILEEFRQHQAKVSFRSDIAPYLDCESHPKLVKYGLKAVPYLVEGLACQEAEDAWVGSGLIPDTNAKTPEEVYKYNCSHRSKSPPSLFFAGIVLMELLPDDMKPSQSIPKEGYADTKEFAWSNWWQQHKHKFIFQTQNPLVIPPAKYIHSKTPQIRTTVNNGLLDIYAVSATYHQIIERAAAEMNIEVFIGEQEYINIIATVRMRAVTFEEFLYIIGRTIFVGGFDHHKTETGYWVGGKNPAKPRAILNGWGIMMERTVFSVGDEIPVTIITRMPGPITIVDPADPTFVCYGSFRVTMNDGKIVKDYDPVTKVHLTVPPIEIKKDCYPIKVLLNKFCKLPVGEYNIQFQYLEHETPSIAIEIYDRQVKRPPLK